MLNAKEEYSIHYLIEVQKAIENKYDNRHLKTYVKEIFQNKVKDINWTEGLETKQINMCHDIMGILMLHMDRLSINALIEILVSRDLIEVNTSVKTIMDCVVILTDHNFIDVEIDDRDRLYIKTLIELTEEEVDKLDELQYKIPMIVPPLPTNQKGNNKGSGYYTKGSDSLILNNEHQYDIDSTVLDRLNSIPFTINTDLMKTIRNHWKCMEELDEEGKPDINIETGQNFDRYEKGVFKTSAILINHGNQFYFTNKYDKRGRVYCSGYHVSFQGNSYAKAQLEFSNKQHITEEINFF